MKHATLTAAALTGAAALVAGLSGIAQAATVTDGAIAYVSNHQIATINPDGSTPRQLTPAVAAGTSAAPAWNHAGTKIAFVNTSPTGLRRIEVMNSNGTGLQILTSSKRSVGPGGPTWSPDDATLAFDGPNSNAARVGDIGPYYLDHIKATANGGTPATYVGELPMFGTINVGDVVGQPNWAADGQIGFVSHNMTSDQPSVEFINTYSPASKAITLQQQSGADTQGFYAHPQNSAARGWAYEQAFNLVGEPKDPSTIVAAGFPRVAGDQSPAWNAADNGLVFVHRDGGGTPHVTLAAANGSGRRQVTTGTAPSSRPVH